MESQIEKIMRAALQAGIVSEVEAMTIMACVDFTEDVTIKSDALRQDFITNYGKKVDLRVGIINEMVVM